MELQRLRQRPSGTFGQLLCGCIVRKDANLARLADLCDRHRATGQDARFDMESWVRPCEDPFLGVTVRVEAPAAELSPTPSQSATDKGDDGVG